MYIDRRLGTCLPGICLLIFSFAVFSKAGAANLPMGSSSDKAYAETLWQAMEKALLVGSGSKHLEPFFGGAKPHGTILEIAAQKLVVGDHTGFLVVKRNYDGDGVSEAAVDADRSKYLKNYTVMYQREDGFDDENQNWFWVKYKPDGALFTKLIAGEAVSLAGKILKGKTEDDNGGCIYCHSSAGGGDYIFYPKIKNE